jgi:hypothetical protein
LEIHSNSDITGVHRFCINYDFSIHLRHKPFLK